MKLGTARIVSLSLLLSALAIAVAASFLTEEGSGAYTGSLILTLLLFAAGLFTALFWGRCPACGKRLFVNFLRLSACPYCRKPLDASGRYGGRKKQAGSRKN